MSHGHSEGSTCDPNLIPLLDVVFQLLMFFMVCVNFATGQVAEEVRLPTSVSVKPIDKADPDWLYVNFKPFHVRDFERRLPEAALAEAREKFQEGDPCILVLGERPMRLLEFRYWLKRQYEQAERLTKDGKVATTIIVRADKDADYGQVFEILNTCRIVGYTRLKLQALTTNTKPGGGSA
jgi:biopolymer transport protein ExbD